MMSVPVMSDGIRSGVNWMRLKTRPSVCAMVRTISVLAVPGKPGDQAVAADKQRDQNLIEHFFLADDHLADLRQDAVAHRVKAFDALLQFCGVQIHFSSGGHRLFSFLGVLELQEQFLSRAIAGSGLKRCQDVLLGLVLLAGRKISLGQIELRGSLVERVQRQHGGDIRESRQDNFSARATGRRDGGAALRRSRDRCS